MKMKAWVLAAGAAGLLMGGAAVFAQQQHQHEEGTGTEQGRGGMMGGAPMMRMMQGCPMMQGMQGMEGMQGMQGSRAHAMPQLPPGNEKLELQMHAEIMQRVGEILAKYAAQVK